MANLQVAETAVPTVADGSPGEATIQTLTPAPYVSALAAEAGPHQAPRAVLTLPEDREAFNRLFQQHQQGLLGLLVRKLGRLEDAQDALAATFLKAWRGRSSFRGEAPAKAWLYTIATNVALDMLRVRRRREVERELELVDGDLPGAVEVSTPDPAAEVLRGEQLAGARRAMEHALDRLPQDDRLILQLFYYEGHSYQEIGSLVGASFSQIRGRLHRIRAKVRRDLVQRQNWQPD